MILTEYPVQTPTPTRAGPGGDQPIGSGGPRWGLAALIVAVGLAVASAGTTQVYAEVQRVRAREAAAETPLVIDA